MAKKGVAISQIILLVLGIIVLAVVAFLLYSNFTTTTGQIDVQKCRSVATNACSACAISKGGVPSDCDAKLYLLSTGDKACAPAIANEGGGVVGFTDPVSKVVTVSGNIDCKQYVGGGGFTGSTCVDKGNLACSNGWSARTVDGVEKCCSN
jgi:hypothetical protein